MHLDSAALGRLLHSDFQRIRQRLNSKTMLYDTHTKVHSTDMVSETVQDPALEVEELLRPMSGAEIFLRSLEAEGVKTVFGYPGGAVIKIYDEMARIKPDFEHVLVRHEQGRHACGGRIREGYGQGGHGPRNEWTRSYQHRHGALPMRTWIPSRS